MLRRALAAFATALGVIPTAARLAVADFPTGDPRTAVARVDFKPALMVRRSMALIEGQGPETLKGSEIFGYGVVAGTGSFYDPEAGKVAEALVKTDPDTWEQRQTGGAANGPKVTGPYQFLLDLPLGPANAIIFGSGWGDGFYASRFGFGAVAALVTDFQVVDWTKVTW